MSRPLFLVLALLLAACVVTPSAATRVDTSDPVAAAPDRTVLQTADRLATTTPGASGSSPSRLDVLPSVAVYVVGVDDPVKRMRMQTDVAALLGRNRVVVDPEHGIPLTLTLERATGGPGTATWRVSLDACDGRRLGRARFSSAAPADATALVAAVTPRLPQMRGWLAADVEPRP